MVGVVYILKVETTRFADLLQIVYKKELKNVYKSFWTEKTKGKTSNLLLYYNLWE